MAVGGAHLAHLGDPRKKKYEHEIRDANGNPIFGAPSGGTSLGDTGGSMEPAMLSSSDIGPGGAGVTTYGWKMFEDEILDRILREKDSLEILQKLLQGLRSAAQTNPDGVADLLRAHPLLAESLQNAMNSEGAPGSGGNGGGGSGGGGGGGAV